MEVKITKGQIEDIEFIAQFQVDMAMESEGTLLDKATLTKGVSAAMNDENKGSTGMLDFLLTVHPKARFIVRRSYGWIQ